MSYLRKKYIIDSSDSETENDKKSDKSSIKKKSIAKNIKHVSDSESDASIEVIPSKYSKTKNNTKIKNTTKTNQKNKPKIVSDSESEPESESEPNSSSDSGPEEKTDKELLAEYNKILKKFWGYDGLKQTQSEIIRKMLVNKIDICAILATGFGKSICYQLPHLISGKCVIVVSPLIALMHEQGLEMQNKKI